jgi:hypothetical protein
VFEAGLDGSVDDPVGWRCSRVGGVAQLGEHLLCKQGVIGSIPIVSTRDWRQMLASVSRMSVFGVIRCRGKAPPVWSRRMPLGLARGWSPARVALFFVFVNQVLVRLWARVIKVSPSGLVAIPSFGWIV